MLIHPIVNCKKLATGVPQLKLIALDLTVTGTETIFVASAKERGGITAARKGRKTRIIFNGSLQCQ